MKKEYNKPDILFESFALSVDIAGGCEEIIDTHLGGQCALTVVGLPAPVFTSSVAACEFPVEDDGKYSNGHCYHVPSETNNLFNS